MEASAIEKIQTIIQYADKGVMVGIIAGESNGEWEQYALKKIGEDKYELRFAPAYKEMDLKEVEYRLSGQFSCADIQIELYKIETESEIVRLIVAG